jgi:hypothetical protein
VPRLALSSPITDIPCCCARAASGHAAAAPAMSVMNARRLDRIACNSLRRAGGRIGA